MLDAYDREIIAGAIDDATLIKQLSSSLRAADLTQMNANLDALKSETQDKEKLPKNIADAIQKAFAKDIATSLDYLKTIKEFCEQRKSGGSSSGNADNGMIDAITALGDRLASNMGSSGGIDGFAAANQSLSQIATGITTMANLFSKAGSGFVHDTHCEIVLKEIRDLIRGGAGIRTPAPASSIPSGGSSSGGDEGSISDAMTAGSQKGLQLAQFAKKHAKVTALTGMGPERLQEFNKVLARSQAITAEHLNTLNVMLSRGVIITKQEKDALRTTLLRVEAGYDETKNLDDMSKKLGDIIKRSGELMNIGERFRSDVKTASTNLANGFLAGVSGGIEVKKVVQGIWGEQVKHNSALHDALFITQGLNEGLDRQRQEYMLLSRQASAIAETGQDMATYQKAFTTNLRMGIRDASTLNRVTRAGLNTATLTGMNAEQTAQTFGQWNTQLGLSGNQMAQVGRQARLAAQSTGLMGDELASALQSAKELANEMRNAGTLTAEAAGSFIQFSAAAKKFGVEKSINPLLKALSSSTELYNNASAQTQALLFQAAQTVGRVGDLQNGQVMNTEGGRRDMGRGLENILNGFLGRFGKTIDTMDTLTDNERTQLNLQLQSAYGMQLGEFKRTIDAYKEGTMTFTDRIASINKQLEGNLTQQEREALLQQQRGLMLQNALTDLTKVDEKAKSAGITMAQALSQANMTQEQLQGRLSDAITNVNESLVKAGKANKQIDPSRIAAALSDPKQYRELLAAINAGEQESAVAARAASDPIIGAAQRAIELQGKIVENTGRIADYLTSYLGPKGVLVMSLLSMLAGTQTGGAMLNNAIVRGMTSLTTMFGQRGGAATATGPASGLLSTALGTHGPGAGALGSTALGTSSRALGTARGGSTALGAVTVNAAGPTGAVPGLPTLPGPELIEQQLGALRKAGPALVKGAVALAILSIGLIALAAGIILIGKGILAITGMSPKDALETAFQIAGIIAAAALIAGAVLAATWGLTLLGELAQNAGEIIVPMLLGAAVLLVLVPAMILLAGAIIWMASGLLSMMQLTPQKAAEVAWAVASILGAAGLIAGAVLLSVVALAALGFLATNPVGWAMAGLMLAGAAVLYALIPAMIRLAGAIITLSAGVISMLGLDPQKTQQTVDAVANIMVAAGKISAAVLIGAVALAALGTLSLPPWGLLLAGTMLLGAATLTALTPAMIELAASTIKLSEAAVKASGVSPEQGEKVVTAVLSIITSAGKIAAAILGASAFLIAIGSFAMSGMVLIPLMALGAAALLLLVPNMISLSLALIKLADGVIKESPISPEDATKTLSAVTTIMEAAGKITTMLLAQMSTLALFGVLGMMGGTITGFLNAGADAFISFSDPIKRFIGSVIDVARSVASTMGSRDVGPMINSLKAVADIIEKTGVVVDTLVSKIVPLTQSSWFGMVSSPLSQLDTATEPLRQGLRSVVNFINDGVLASVRRLPNMSGLQNQVNSLKAVGDLVESLGKVVDTIQTKIMPLTQSTRVGMFGTGPSQLESMLQNSSLTQVLNYVAGLVMMMTQANPIMAMFGMNKSPLQIIADGRTSIQGAVTALNSITTLMTSLPRIIDRLNAALTAATQKSIDPTKATAFASWLSDLSMSISSDDIQDAIEDIDQLAAALQDLATSLEGLDEAFQPLATIQIDDRLGSVLENVAENAQMSISNNATTMEPTSYSYDEAVQPVRPNMQQNTMQTQIGQQLAGAEPPAGISAANQQLGEIAANTRQMATQLAQSNSILGQILNTLSGGGGSGGGRGVDMGTTSDTTPPSTPLFPKLAFDFNGGAQKRYIQTGSY